MKLTFQSPTWLWKDDDAYRRAVKRLSEMVGRESLLQKIDRLMARSASLNPIRLLVKLIGPARTEV